MSFVAAARLSELWEGEMIGLTLRGSKVLLVHCPAGVRAYAQAVRAAGDAGLLRQAFVHRAGHCTFTPAERIAALQALVHRVETGAWADATAPERLNPAATALGAGLNILLLSATTQVPTPPAFQAYAPGPFLRPFNLPPFVPNVADPLRLDTAA